MAIRVLSRHLTKTALIRLNSNQIIRDFIRFTFVIGMRTQALRVQVTSKKMRRVVIVQCIVSFRRDVTVAAASGE